MERARKIIHNRARCKNCGDIIESMDTHDWVCCTCFHKSNGETGIFIDGGSNYLRRGGHPEYIEEMNETRLFTDEEVEEYNNRMEEQCKMFGRETFDRMV